MAAYSDNHLAQLKGFYYTAKFRSVSLAANFLQVSQPAVSLQIKSLQESLGKKLLQYSKRKMILTKDGEFLMEEVERILKRIEDIYTNNSNQIKREINIVATHESIIYILPNILKKFKEVDEETTVHIELVNPAQGLELIRESADFFFTTKPLETPNYCEFTNIKSYKQMLIANQNHSLASKKKISINDILSNDLIIPPSKFSSLNNVKDLFNDSTIKPSLTITFSDWEMIKPYVQSGTCISIVSEIAVKKEDNLFTYPLDKYLEDIEYGFLTFKHKTKPAFMKEFKELASKTSL